MRHSIHVLWLVPFLAVAALGADELPRPKKDPSAPPAAFPDLGPRPPGPVVPPDANAAELQRLLRELRSQRDALHSERAAPDRAAPASANEQELARLRKRMEELQKRSRPRPDTGPSVVLPPDPPLTSPTGTSAGGAIDLVAVAQNLFRAGDYEAALDAYRKVPLRGATGEERAPTLYMVATCLRKLGKRDEAIKVYREVASVKDDPFVADCARWQLETISWHKDVDGQIARLRQRRKGLEMKP